MKKMEIVCAIIKQDKQYLIAKRGKGIHENIWEFPGGKVEENETLKEAIQREIQEELELDVEVISFVKDIWDERSDVLLHVSAFLCIVKGGTLHLHVHHEARFVEVQDLYNYTFEKADQPILDTLLEMEKQ